MIPREAFILAAFPFFGFFRTRRLTPARTPIPGDTDPAPHLHAALVATTELYNDAATRGDLMAMRAYAQAVRCLLLPTRMYLRDDDDLAPQPEWPL